MSEGLGLARLPDGMHLLVYMGLLFLISQGAGRVANLLRAPRLTGYLVAGILCGPSVTALFDRRLVEHDLTLVTNIALALIAFSIGGSLRLEKLRGLGGTILRVTVVEATAAAAVVFAVAAWALPWLAGAPGDSFLRGHLPVALVLGSLSAATAPAAVVSVVHESRARGPFTTVLLGVIALDDGVALILFALAIAVAQSLSAGVPMTGPDLLLIPLGRIGLAVLLGSALGLALKPIMAAFESRDTMLGVTLGAILLTSGLALTLGVSELLANMMMGLVVSNFVQHERADEAFEVIDGIEEPVFGAFFLLAGAHLDLAVALGAGGLAVVLVAARFAGKLLGAGVGASLGQAPPTVKRYLGLALLPAAGVSVGLVLQARLALPDVPPHLLELMVSGVVGNILINELLSPFLLRLALVRAGEAQPRAGRPVRGTS